MVNTIHSTLIVFAPGHKTGKLVLCEVCGKRKPVVTCQYCHKHLCSKCYGSWTEARACCGQEDEIFQKHKERPQ